MTYTVKMPKLGMEMREGELLEWHVSAGEEVTSGEVICEIESEKVVHEVESRESGTVGALLLDPGEVVEPGTPVAVILGPGESMDEVDIDTETAADVDGGGDASGGSTPAVTGASDSVADAPDKPVTPAARKRAEELDIDPAAVEGTGPQGAVTSDDVEAAAESQATEEPKTTPRARRRASDLDVDLATVDGTGPQGAITAEDVERATGAGADEPATGDAAPAQAAASEPTVGGAASDTAEEVRELTGMRTTIADRLSRSYREAVHVTAHRDVPVGELQEAKDDLSAGLAVDLSLVDVLLVALSETLAEHPRFNATFVDGELAIRDRQDVGLAVDVDEGLVTPALSELESRSLPDIAAERNRLTERAQAGAYDELDLSAGTFTITNLGPFGIDSFTPIIDPPQVAILGISRVRRRPVPDGDGVSFRPELGLDLSFDHRVVDGADAARFLRTLAEHVADPWPVLVDRF